jgi:hypothetical protein
VKNELILYMKALFYFLLFIFSFVSCTYDCARSSGVMANFISFTEQEINSFTIKKYAKGTSFNTFIDSFAVDQSVTDYRRSNDTLKWAWSKSSARMSSDFDYRITIPSVNASYQITELNEPRKEGRKSTKKIMCGNQIISCKVNGELTSISHDNLFIKK